MNELMRKETQEAVRHSGADTGAIKGPIGRRAGVGLWDVLEIFCGLCLAGLSVD